ncbi:MAG: class I SAM-dependent methyltransferase [Alphaproteobacteria bacterium]|nr:class I SAM-dependent methyltransferase [Alphaproteobacteria bacterium]
MTARLFADDPRQNARLCLTIAPAHCSSCGDFHLASIMRRASLLPEERIFDDAEFGAAMAEVLGRLGNEKGAIRVLIAGSTDTGLYTSLLNAAAAAGGEAFARSLSVTLVDQCGTPLEICRRYARANGLQLETVLSDLAGHEPETAFDMIVMHGVLTFFPEAERLAYMRRVAAWLAPQGALISSVQFGEKVGADEPSKRIAQALENLQVLLDEAGGYPQEFARDMGQRVERGLRDRHGHRNPFPDREAVRSFYGSTGLEVQSLDIVGERNDGGPKRRYSGRSIAVCGPGGREDESRSVRKAATATNP